MRPSALFLLTRLGPAIAGKILPPTAALQIAARDAKRGIVAAVMTGMLAALTAVAGCFCLYQYILTQGLTPVAAAGVCTAVLMLITFITALVSARSFRRAANVKDRLNPPSKAKGPPPEPEKKEAAGASFIADAAGIFSAFVEGLNEPSSRKTKDEAPSPAVHPNAPVYGPPPPLKR